MEEKKHNKSLLEDISMDEAQVSSLVEKYDAESRYRRLTGAQGIFISLWHRRDTGCI